MTQVTRDASVSSGPVRPDASTMSKPRLRGHLHQWCFVASIVVGVGLVVTRSGTANTIAALIYAAGVVTMFGVSALFHRVEWTPAKVGPMLQLDKTGIYVMISASFTPVAAVGIGGRFGMTLLVAVWAVSLLLIAALWLPWTPPYGLTTGTYIGVSSIALLALPRMWNDISPLFTVLILLGGAMFIGGAFLLALRKPDPWPEVFGYHEVWHVLVFVAAAIHYVAITRYVL